MQNQSNEALLQMLENLSGQMALAESLNQPRKEKQFEKRILEIEKEILRRLDTKVK